MKNKILCKFLCHNLVVLIHEMHELGIDPVFWATGMEISDHIWGTQELCSRVLIVKRKKTCRLAECQRMLSCPN
jgi:hypothetical protein